MRLGLLQSYLLPPDVHSNSFQDLLWLEMMTNAAGEEKCSRLVMIAWALWCNRNEIYHGGEGKTGPVVALWAASYLQEYWFAVETHDAAVSNMALHLAERPEGALHSAWVPPPSGSCKINVDGALFPTKKSAGIGVVIREMRGRLVAALCRKIRAPLGVLEVEAKAYEAGVLLSRHLGLQVGVLEGDSLTISNALKRVTEPPISVVAIVKGIHALGSEIGVVHYTHVRRTGNQPAHILAKQAQSLVNDVIWIEETSYCIQQALIQDVFGS